MSPTRCGGTTGTCSPSNTSAPASSRSISDGRHDRRAGHAVHRDLWGGQVIDPESVCDGGGDERAIRARVDHQPERSAPIDHDGRDDATDPVHRSGRRELRSESMRRGRLTGERGAAQDVEADRGGGCRNLRRGRECHAPQPRKREGRDHHALHEDQYGRRPVGAAMQSVAVLAAVVRGGRAERVGLPSI